MSSNKLPYVADLISSPSVLVDPLEFSYFTNLSVDSWRYTKYLASKLISSTDDQNLVSYLNNYATMEKAGECITSAFMEYYFPDSYTCNNMAPFLGNTFTLGDKKVSVHTRMLKMRDNTTLDGLRLNVRKFVMMVPELCLDREADIYIFCGFDTSNLEGFLFGWLPSEELSKIEITPDLQVPAKCINIPDLRTIYTIDSII